MSAASTSPAGQDQRAAAPWHNGLDSGGCRLSIEGNQTQVQFALNRSLANADEHLDRRKTVRDLELHLVAENAVDGQFRVDEAQQVRAAIDLGDELIARIILGDFENDLRFPGADGQMKRVTAEENSGRSQHIARTVEDSLQIVAIRHDF